MITPAAQRQKRFRLRRHERELRMRLLLRETVRALRRNCTHTHGPLQISFCRLCGGADEHTPQCLIYRAERALEEELP
jgi:hypothetical protein